MDIVEEINKMKSQMELLRKEKEDLLLKVKRKEEEIATLKSPKKINYNCYIPNHFDPYDTVVRLNRHIEEVYGCGLFMSSYSGSEEEDVVVMFDEELAIRKI